MSSLFGLSHNVSLWNEILLSNSTVYFKTLITSVSVPRPSFNHRIFRRTRENRDGTMKHGTQRTETRNKKTRLLSTSESVSFSLIATDNYMSLLRRTRENKT